MELLKTPHGIFNCYVNPVQFLDEIYYHISFVDKSNKTHTVLMSKSESGWTFLNQDSLPSWIPYLQEQFAEMIEKEMHKARQEAASLA